MNTHDRRRVLAPLLLFVLCGSTIIVGLSLARSVHAPTQVPLSTVLRLSARHAILRARLETDGTVQVVTRSGQTLASRKEGGDILSDMLTTNGAEVTVDAAPLFDAGTLVVLALLLVTGGGLFAITARRAPGLTNRLRPGKAVAGVQVSPPAVTFDQVGGVDEVKGELVELVTFLQSPERFTRVGARIPRGVLLSGPPGTGKTLLARAVAGEAKVPFFSMSGSAFVEMYVGVGAARVRELFARARKAAPCIVFIDEIDAVGGKRSSGKNAGGNDEREQTLNQLLVEMDGFAADAGVIVLAATNRPDLLDSALLRPGRFDRRVTVPLPDRAGRRAVLAVHTSNVALAEAVDLDALAGQTSGMSPADLANVINEAALTAARQGATTVSAAHLDDAILRVLAGPEMTSRVMSPALKRVIAYHEVGHAVVMRQLPHCDPVVKVQAIARGNALGITVSRPREDQYLLTRSALIERMTGLMGGRAAEEVFFAEVTTGAQQDIAQANAIARRMVCEFGMSPLGHVCVSDSAPLSPELAARVDEATRVLVADAYERARDIILKRYAAVDAIGTHLIEVETMDGDELDAWLSRYPSAAEQPTQAA